MDALLRLGINTLPPSVNSIYRTGRAGQRYKKPEVLEWQEDIAEFMREDWKEKDTYTGEILVQVLFVVPNRRRWDVDNRLKALLDCLQIAGVIKDDSQIAGITAERRRGDTVKTLIAVHEYNGAMELYKESWEFLTAWGREESHEK